MTFLFRIPLFQIYSAQQVLTLLSRLLALLKISARQIDVCGLLFAFVKGAGNLSVTNSMLKNNVECSFFFTYFYFTTVAKRCANFNLIKKLRQLL